MRLESANSITHGIGVGLSLAATGFLIAQSSRTFDMWKTVSFSVYGTCMILVFLSSTLYHAMMRPKLKRIFLVLDHSAIYLAIAGTYTPFMLVLLRGTIGWLLFSLVWALAICGIIFKTKFINRYDFISTAAYVLMGWIIVLGMKSFISAMPVNGLVLFFAGGAAYTLGTIFYAWRSLPYHHMVWHIFVLSGSILHFLSIYLYVL